MLWTITRDVLADELELDTNDVGVYGPRGATPSATKGYSFRMYDDDDILYYEGLLFGDKDSLEGFAPLDDFGTPNAGCTRIDYYNDNTKEWETL